MIDTRKRKVAMCSQCDIGEHEHCLGVVFLYDQQRFRACQCAFVRNDGSIGHAAV